MLVKQPFSWQVGKRIAVLQHHCCFKLKVWKVYCFGILLDSLCEKFKLLTRNFCLPTDGTNAWVFLFSDSHAHEKWKKRTEKQQTFESFGYYKSLRKRKLTLSVCFCLGKNFAWDYCDLQSLVQCCRKLLFQECFHRWKSFRSNELWKDMIFGNFWKQ